MPAACGRGPSGHASRRVTDGRNGNKDAAAGKERDVLEHLLASLASHGRFFRLARSLPPSLPLMLSKSQTALAPIQCLSAYVYVCIDGISSGNT